MRRDEADSRQIKATHVALAEVAEILEPFVGAVIVGGTVPFLLIPQEEEPHEGTLDIDVVLDVDRLQGDSERTLHDLLVGQLFVQDTRKPFKYTKAIEVGDERREVLIELLCGGMPPPNGLRRIDGEDVYASVIEGMQIALDAPVLAKAPGDRDIWVTSISCFLAMKAFALERREQAKKPKDAYDIVYCLRNYPGGVDLIAAEMNARLPNLLLAEGIERLKQLFASKNSVGPSSYAKRAQVEGEDSFLRQEAFERVSDLLDKLP